MKILIAEDDLTSRGILTAVVKKWDFDLVVAEDGGTAWDALQQSDAPQLLLLDWNMPGMDGLEICRRLRKNGSSNPPYVILLTARSEKGDIVMGLEAGANDFVAKPYDSEELQARIKVGQRMLEMQSHLLKARDDLAHQATHDFLTGVFNRRAIQDRLKQEISRAGRENDSLSVGMLDIDHFKNINDTYGHHVGDEALVAFTGCIQSELREYDCFGRYGGEEFLVIAPGAIELERESLLERKNLFERLRARIAATRIASKAGSISLTVSIGVATGTGQTPSDTLIALADAALYQAKAAGRNRVVLAVHPEINHLRPGAQLGLPLDIQYALH